MITVKQDTPKIKWSLFVSWKCRTLLIGLFETPDQVGEIKFPFPGFTTLNRSLKSLQNIGEISYLNLKRMYPRLIASFSPFDLEKNLMRRLFKETPPTNQTNPLLTKDQIHIIKEDVVFNVWFYFLDPFTARNLALTCKKYYNAIFQMKIKKNYLRSGGIRKVREMIRFNIPNMKVRVLVGDQNSWITCCVDEDDKKKN